MPPYFREVNFYDMEINMIKGEYLLPCSEQDEIKYNKLKHGKVYKLTIKEFRNYQFHKKYFKLFLTAWEFLNEKQQNFFKTFESFRKTIELAAGHSETIYSIERKEFVEVVKSVSFDNLCQSEFEDLYSRVLDVLLKYPLKNIDQDFFYRKIDKFL